MKVSPVDRSDAEFDCARWEPLAPNSNFRTTSTRGVRSVIEVWIGLWTEPWGEFGQQCVASLGTCLAPLRLSVHA